MAIRHNYITEQDVENSIQNLAAKIAGIGQDASGVIPTREPVEPQIQQDANNYKQDTGGIVPDRSLSSVERRNDLAMESSIIDRQKLAEHVANMIFGRSLPVQESTTNISSPELQQILKEAAEIIKPVNFDRVTLGNYTEQEMAELDQYIEEQVNEVMRERYLPAFKAMIESGLPDVMVAEATNNLTKKKKEVKAKLKKEIMNKNLKVKDLKAKKECMGSGLAFGKGSKQECGNNCSSSLPSSSSFGNRA